MNKREALKLISDMGDIWLMRIEHLKAIYFNQSETDNRRLKAFLLALTLNKRIRILMNYTNKINCIGMPEYESGGYSASINNTP